MNALLDDLVPVPGLSGQEDAIARRMADRLEPLVDAVRIDALGNVIARRGGPDGSPRIALLAHMDTIGFLVKTANEDGFLRVVPVGGVNVKALPGAAVQVDAWPGVIAVRSQHLARFGDSAASLDDLVIQVDPAAQIDVTTPVYYAPRRVSLGADLYCSPYLDNRAGCAVLLDIARQLAADPPPCTVYLIGTVQEETTCLGAQAALQAVAPDAAIFIDGTVSYDTPETHGMGSVRLGAGPVLTAFLYVNGLNGWHAHPGLRAHLRRVAAEDAIPVQQDAVRGLMSDARSAAPLGIPSALIGLPMRGKHAPLETVHLADLRHAARLVAAALHRPLPELTRG